MDRNRAAEQELGRICAGFTFACSRRLATLADSLSHRRLRAGYTTAAPRLVVAVKWVRGNGAGGHGPPDIRAITREAGCLAACRGHESILEILDVATDAETGDVSLFMELVADGRTLRESLWRPVSEEVTRVMMEQLLDAAKKIHGAGVIHRDFKLENVMVGFFGGLKVGDFGSAMRAKPAGVPYEECCVGTLIYTSPEQLEGNRYYGQAVDMLLSK
uniref:Uncharacterized protein n=1 Tax=Aegilops tauschii TaxID=37682 RepID=M8B2J1_AEGTA